MGSLDSDLNSKRYTDRFAEVLGRRGGAPEAAVALALARLTSEQGRLQSTSDALARALGVTLGGLGRGSSGGGGGGGGRTPLSARLELEQEWFRRKLFEAFEETAGAAAAEESEGRETGSVEWRSSRGEMGPSGSGGASLGARAAGEAGEAGEASATWAAPGFAAAWALQVLGVPKGVPKAVLGPEATHTRTALLPLVARRGALGGGRSVRVAATSHGHGDRSGGCIYSARCITVNGLPCGGGGRGHSVVALCPASGALLVAGVTFDT